METIDRQKFGGFVAARRRELGLTQQALADRLFLSNKAVSKWETGQSLPDIALLEPLAQCLEVSVAELLRGERIQERPLEPEETEKLVGRAISFADGAGKPRARRRRMGWLVSAVLAAAETLGLLAVYGWEAVWGDGILAMEALFLAVGLWAAFFAPERLARYYDENKVTTFSQGPVRLNLAFIPLHNGNWPHIRSVLWWWGAVTAAAYPAIYALLRCLDPRWMIHWLSVGSAAALLLSVPAFWVAIKYR